MVWRLIPVQAGRMEISGFFAKEGGKIGFNMILVCLLG